MANDAKHIIDPFDFHPTDLPKGMDDYNLEYLTSDQQKSLNHHKTETIRDNNKYLFEHPEIQAVLQVIMRKLLLERPSHDIESFIGKYFAENWSEIEEQVENYCRGLPKKPKPKISKVALKEERHVVLDDTRYDIYSISSKESLVDDSLIKSTCREILYDIIDNVMECDSKAKKLPDVTEPEEENVSKKSSDDDDDVYLDLGLDFEIDFSGYHDEDDFIP